MCQFKLTDLSYSILNEWYLILFPSEPKRYINIEPLLNFIPIKVHRVFLSYNVVRVSSHYLIFYHHIYARELSNRSIFHAGRYLDDKEICYLGTVIVTANVCCVFGTQYWSQISAKLQTSLAKPCVFAIQSLDKCCCYP